jgi:Tol biopolymer transport system component
LRPVFAPNGRSLVIVASVNQSSSAYGSTNTHVYEVPLAGGEPRASTTGTSTCDSPAFSPDGTSLCVRAAEEWGRIYALDVSRAPRGGGPARRAS